MLEPGFESFPSPESSDDDEIIAYAFMYCATAVKEWPRFRRELEAEGNPHKRCDNIEKHAIDVFREVRDAIITAIDTDKPAVMSVPRLLDRLVHAHAILALYADTTSLPKYRQMLCPELRAEHQGDFNQALWGACWNDPAVESPADVTRKESLRNLRAHRKDGVYNTNGRRDPVARAQERIEPIFAGEVVPPLFPASEPYNKPPDWLTVLRPLSVIELAICREEVRRLGKASGLRREQTQFLCKMVFEGANQVDNPAAWKAIRKAKSSRLLVEVQTLLESRPGKLFLPCNQ
jgi:hypothetical protein